MAIKDVKVWNNRERTEYRIYVHTADGREGCLYLTGNKWNSPGAKTGDLSEQDWKDAEALALRNERWYTTYATPKPQVRATAGGWQGRGAGHGNPARCMDRGWGRCGVCFDCIAGE